VVPKTILDLYHNKHSNKLRSTDNNWITEYLVKSCEVPQLLRSFGMT